MFYTNFDNNITDKHGIIVKNWPLPAFSAPGDIRTVTELKILYNAWESGTAHFYQMTTAEATKWVNERHSTSVPLAGDATVDNSEQTDPSDTDDATVNHADPAENNTDNATVNLSEQANADPAENNIDNATVNLSEQANADPAENNTDNATVNPSEQANPSPTDPPTTSEQATIANPSVSSLPTANHNPDPSSPTATASSRKRAQAMEAQPSNKRRRQGLTLAFINTVITSVDGATIVMNKRPRKECSDKGKKRAK